MANQVGGKKMATRQSMEDFLQYCEDMIQSAKMQYEEAQLQEHFNGVGYSSAQQALEDAYNELEHFDSSCNAQQREQLKLMRSQLLQLQHDMILLEH